MRDIDDIDFACWYENIPAINLWERVCRAWQYHPISGQPTTLDHGVIITMARMMFKRKIALQRIDDVLAIMDGAIEAREVDQRGS